MTGSIKLQLDTYNNDEDAIAAVEGVAVDLDPIATDIAEKEYDSASADLDDMINKLQAVKNYVDTLIEGKK